MKMAYVFNVRLPSEKAHAYQCVKNCEAFSRFVDVELIAPIRWRHSSGVGEKHVSDPLSFYGVRGFTLTRLPCIDLLWFGPPFLEKFLFYPLYQATFVLSSLFYLLKRKPDIVYTRSSLAAVVLSVMLKKPVCLEQHLCHGSLPEKLGLRAASLVVAMTEHLRERLSSVHNIPLEKILTAHDGVDVEMFATNPSQSSTRQALGLPVDRRIIGYAGQFETLGVEKGIDTLLKAMKFLRKRDNIVLCLVGGPKERQVRYGELAADLGIRDNLIMVNQVSPTQIPNYLAAFDACIIPSPWTEYFAYSASPLKLFEYMAAGKPIVATNLPAIREILQNAKNAVLVEPSNPPALAEGILTVLEDKTFAERIAMQAREDVKKYAWEKRVERILNAFGS